MAKGYIISKEEKEIEQRLIKNKLKMHEFKDSIYMDSLNKANEKLMNKLLKIANSKYF